MADKAVKETSLYMPVRDYLAGAGYRALGEVCGVDVVGFDGQQLVAVELKLTLNLALVAQAVQRQKFADLVWVAVPRPKNKWKWLRANSDNIRVLRRLGLGLLLVPPSKSRSAVDQVLAPREKQARIVKKLRSAILKEMEGRSGDRNLGGCTRTTIVTAYREAAVAIASMLAEHGALSCKELRKIGCHANTQRILHNNYYGWFENVSRGTYKLTEKGLSEHRSLTEPEC